MLATINSAEFVSDTMPDAERYSALIDLIAREKDKRAFSELFEHFAPRIKAIMVRAGAQPAFADDLAQEAMLTVWRKAALYSPDKGGASTWIFTIARNLRIDRLRRQSSQPHQDIDDLEMPSGQDSSEDVVVREQIVANVSAAIANLPEDQRRVVELSYIQDLAHGSIAEQLKIPIGTVKSRLRLAYEKLRPELEILR